MKRPANAPAKLQNKNTTAQSTLGDTGSLKYSRYFSIDYAIDFVGKNWNGLDQACHRFFFTKIHKCVYAFEPPGRKLFLRKSSGEIRKKRKK